MRIFSLLAILLCVTTSLYARVENELDLYERVHVISDKAYRHGNRNVFEAVGNIVATFQDKSLYAEKLSVNYETGEVHVLGNVRFVAAGATVYGTEMNLQTKSGEYSLKNARVNAGNFVVLGKELVRRKDKTLYGQDAEYTTCLDCPESWVISGKEINITLGEYVTIKHALVKVKGVEIMYIPFIIFPVKDDRQSGLLFPKLSLSLDDGFTYQQPFYWAINDYSDMTITPSSWGDRGIGTELQYRQNFGHRRWIEFNNMSVFDKLYHENTTIEDERDDSYFRHFTGAEYHYSFSKNFNHHLNFTGVKDHDIFRDFDDYTEDFLTSSETGLDVNFDYRGDMVNASLEGTYLQNMLTPDATSMDKNFVQVLPQVKFSMAPTTIVHSKLPFLSDISMGIDTDFTRFRQMDKLEGEYIRNADRYHAVPYLDWNLGNLGPVNFSSNAKMEMYRYHFPNEEKDYFGRVEAVLENEASFGVEKVFGIAKVDYVDVLGQKKKNVVSDVITGSIPAFSYVGPGEKEAKVKNSYRHQQDFRLKHFYSLNESYHGNEKFQKQITFDEGLFDHFDAILNDQHNLSSSTLKKELPIKNTVEMQWNNTLTRKTPKNFSVFDDERLLRDNFNYDQVAYFNVSQGYDFSEEDSSKAWTRLHVESGINFDSFGVSMSEYFFYKGSKHIFDFGISQDFDKFTSGLSYLYNNASLTKEHELQINFDAHPIDLLSFYFRYSYDFADSTLSESKIGFTYHPSNHCWTLTVGQSRDEIDTRYAFHFEINFNDKSFNSVDFF